MVDDDEIHGCYAVIKTSWSCLETRGISYFQGDQNFQRNSSFQTPCLKKPSLFFSRYRHRALNNLKSERFIFYFELKNKAILLFSSHFIIWKENHPHKAARFLRLLAY